MHVRRRPRPKPGPRYRLAAPITVPVCAALQALDCRLNLSQVTLGLPHERCNLRPLEGDRRTLRIVLVIGVAVTGGCHHLIEVAGQCREALEGQSSLLLKELVNPVHPSMVTALAAMKAMGLLGIRTSRAPSCSRCVNWQTTRLHQRRIHQVRRETSRSQSGRAVPSGGAISSKASTSSWNALRMRSGSGIAAASTLKPTQTLPA